MNKGIILPRGPTACGTVTLLSGGGHDGDTRDGSPPSLVGADSHSPNRARPENWTPITCTTQTITGRVTFTPGKTTSTRLYGRSDNSGTRPTSVAWHRSLGRSSMPAHPTTAGASLTTPERIEPKNAECGIPHRPVVICRWIVIFIPFHRPHDVSSLVWHGGAKMPFDSPYQTPFGDVELLWDTRRRIASRGDWVQGRFQDGNRRCLVAALSIAAGAGASTCRTDWSDGSPGFLLRSFLRSASGQE